VSRYHTPEQKAAHAAYNRRYNAEHREARNAHSAEMYRTESPERRAIREAKGKAWRAAHPEAGAEAATRYRAKNKDAISAKSREQRRAETPEQREARLAHRREEKKKRTPEQIEAEAAYNREWAKTNREARNAYQRRLLQDLTPEQREARAARVKQWQKMNPEAVAVRKRANKIMRKGAPGRHTANDILELLERQGYRCAAPHCGVDILRNYHVDHIVPLARGGSNWPDNLQVLCPTCNMSKKATPMDEWLARLPSVCPVDPTIID
jgi:5-methylcytosine-specific restriction endonuclease McrA